MHTYCVTSFKMGQFINVRSLKNDAVTLGSLISLHYVHYMLARKLLHNC